MSDQIADMLDIKVADQPKDDYPINQFSLKLKSKQLNTMSFQLN
jgi:hypothetical protein